MVKLKPLPLDGVFHALSDPTRRDIVQRLSTQPTRISDLAAPFRMSLPAVSKHIRVLESAGLVTRRKEGRESTISLQSEPMTNAIDWLDRHRRHWEHAFDNLEAFLKQDHPPKTENPKKPKKGKKT
ncbi:MAG: metalloregulator ArsR/SmtB family transcription factor [Methylacidiphilales bacterium]|nr:metalloregulator ArsR/SmtB family transcription factor [Candidatus Methylacidiphilales bacterium]